MTETPTKPAPFDAEAAADHLTKTCNTCGVEKPLSEYHRDRHKRDGWAGICKACRIPQEREYYGQNREAVLTKQRLYYGRNRESLLAKDRAYYRRNRSKLLARDRAWKKSRPEVARAGALVQAAVARGRLHQGPCEGCGSRARIDAHHDDYSKPLDVRWLCRSCHLRLHAERHPLTPETDPNPTEEGDNA